MLGRGLAVASALGAIGRWLRISVQLLRQEGKEGKEPVFDVQLPPWLLMEEREAFLDRLELDEGPCWPCARGRCPAGDAWAGRGWACNCGVYRGSVARPIGWKGTALSRGRRRNRGAAAAGFSTVVRAPVPLQGRWS